MLSRVFNFVKTIFGRPTYNHEHDLQQHDIISRKRRADATFSDGSPNKRQCLDSGVPGFAVMNDTTEKDSYPLRILTQDSTYFTKPEMRKTSPIGRKGTGKALPFCRGTDFMGLKGPGDGFTSLRSTNQGKENNVIEISDNEDDEVTHQHVHTGTHLPAKRNGDSRWVNIQPKHNTTSKSFQHSCFNMKSKSIKDDNLPSKSSDLHPGSTQWHAFDSSSSRMHNRVFRGKLTLRPKRLDSKQYPSMPLTASSIRGIEEAVRLEEKNNYSMLLKQYEAEKTVQPVHARSVTHPTKFVGVFSGQQTPLVSFTKSRGKIELIDLTSKVKDLVPNIRRDQEVKPQTVAAKMASGSTQIAAPITKPSVPMINSFEDLIKFNKYYQSKFLPDTIRKFDDKKYESEKELREPLYRAEQYARQNENHMKQIEERMMRHIKITDAEIVLDDTAEEEAELPCLTPRMEKAIDAALAPKPPQETLVEAFSLKITRHDMHTLANLNWLNDEVINFYMNLLIERGKLGTHPRVYAFNTFFYSKLLSGGHAMLKRWTRKIDIFSHDIIIVPVHLGMHWCMSAIDFRNKTIKYYDSMGNPNNRCLQALAKYLEDESLDKKKVPYDTSNWKLINVKDNPQQMNGSDCGVFACMYAEFICRGMKITFTQANMPYFRRKMVYEILHAKLLK